MRSIATVPAAARSRPSGRSAGWSKAVAGLLVTIGIALGLAPSAAHAQSGSCGCGDVRDLFNRYCAANAAIAEWNRLTRTFRDREWRNGGVIMMTPAIKEDIKDCVNEAIGMANAEGPGHRHSDGVTDQDCKVSVNAPNKCMAGVISAHEAWHRQMCEAAKKPDAPWRSEVGNPFRWLLAEHVERLWGSSAVDYMHEERTGYAIEANYTRNRLEELAGQCSESRVYKPTRQGRSFTLQACPVPDPKEYKGLSCKFPR